MVDKALRFKLITGTLILAVASIFILAFAPDLFLEKDPELLSFFNVNSPKELEKAEALVDRFNRIISQ